MVVVLTNFLVQNIDNMFIVSHYKIGAILKWFIVYD